MIGRETKECLKSEPCSLDVVGPAVDLRLLRAVAEDKHQNSCYVVRLTVLSNPDAC